MNGFRNKKRVNPFVQIDKNMLSDKNISWKAKGILAYLLSKPDDWVTYAKDIEKQSTDGRDSVANGINELIGAGYMVRKRVREKGRFKGYEYSVYEYPESIANTENGFPVNGETGNGKTENGKPATTNNDLSNNDFSNNDLTNINNNDSARETAFSFYEKNGFGILTPHVGDKIGAWIEDTNEDLVILAMQISVENSVPRWSYAESILQDWQKKKIESVEHVFAHEAKRKMQMSAKNNGSYRRGPAKEEVVPEWFGSSQAATEQTAREEISSEDVDHKREALLAKLAKMRGEGN